ncbi:uncharacterized protein LOC132558326 [Ylistrum balloti]|uniref:uncharacterized protein LOC132558326 n=1 Tax=Ylistrum balloti TaxID=509963 RepID=UPI002905E35A|nr:uncharacterized protein LOC132558326 [Ylistrum balloti]
MEAMECVIDVQECPYYKVCVILNTPGVATTFVLCSHETSHGKIEGSLCGILWKRRKDWFDNLLYMEQIMSSHIGKYKEVVNWDTGILGESNHKGNKCPKRGDISDWTLKCKYICKEIQLTTTKNRRVQLVPICDSTRGYLVQERTDNINSVPLLQFRHPCVKSFLLHNCSSRHPVPNIIHYVWYGMRPMRFYHFLSVYSSFKMQKPCVIFIHGDFMPFGEYWNLLLMIVPNILFLQQSPPATIANRTIGHIEHKADITRLMVLKEYGGIYMDTDEVLLRTLDPLRRHNFTLSRAFSFNLSNGLILSTRNATFLNIWITAYKTYDPHRWGFHSTIVPSRLSKVHPRLIHIENKTFVRPDASHKDDLFYNNFDWSKNYAIHLFMRFYKQVYSVTSIRTLNCTIGAVARFVLFGHKELCVE